MKKIIFLCCGFLLFSLGNAGAEVIKKGETLTLTRCISIALKYSPIIAEAENTVKVNESQIGQAKAGYYPQVSATTNYSRQLPASPSNVTVSSGVFNQYSAGLGLQQNIYDFGKTSSKINIAKSNTRASYATLYNTEQQVIFNVTQAYFNVGQTQKVVDVDKQAIAEYQQQLNQAKAGYNVGVKPLIDVTNAQVSLGNAKLNLINGENNLKDAEISLNIAMGIPNPPSYTLKNTLSFKPYNITLNKALTSAYQNRQDLKSLHFQEQAAVYNEHLAKTGYYPTISGNADYDWGGQDFPLSHGWSVLLTFSLPIFNGYLTKYQIKQAEANLEVLRSDENQLRQSIYSVVQQDYLNLQSAIQQIQVAKTTVKQAKQNLDIARGSYKVGVATYLDVTTAIVSYLTAQQNYIQALYNYRIAQAGLEQAMGVIK
ncbi:MAG: TolC family protein [Actinobacteria bacterium]|nr:TolC family protein [Actinomycetota bacterium]MCL5674935.1 TolC family protein [Candidatus Omnitrophota bacterium]